MQFNALWQFLYTIVPLQILITPENTVSQYAQLKIQGIAELISCCAFPVTVDTWTHKSENDPFPSGSDDSV